MGTVNAAVARASQGQDEVRWANGRLIAPDGSVLGVSELSPVGTPITASAQVLSGPGEFAGYNVSVLGTGTLTVYDSLTGSGKVIYGPVNLTLGPVQPKFRLKCDIGCYFTLSGAGNTIAPYVSLD